MFVAFKPFLFRSIVLCIYCNCIYSPSGLYCATMVTVCPAFFRAAAACSCVALDRSTPFTYAHTERERERELKADAGSIAINV